ncbi:hypothetical protein K438DRAFT_1785716 [Mycena galopus ATCC 62051]|nr:hypothetical protein K438DRAFT_1785716 [Mycena galopus ATCC 62051]
MQSPEECFGGQAVNVAAAATQPTTCFHLEYLESPWIFVPNTLLIFELHTAGLWLLTLIHNMLQVASSGRLKHIRNLIEGNPNIRADATPLSLRESGIATMEPKIIHALRGFQLKAEKIVNVLREISNSVDLAREPPNVPYFYAHCLTGKAKGKDGAHGFRKPTRLF